MSSTFCHAVHTSSLFHCTHHRRMQPTLMMLMLRIVAAPHVHADNLYRWRQPKRYSINDEDERQQEEPRVLLWIEGDKNTTTSSR